LTHSCSGWCGHSVADMNTSSASAVTVSSVAASTVRAVTSWFERALGGAAAAAAADPVTRNDVSIERWALASVSPAYGLDPRPAAAYPATGEPETAAPAVERLTVWAAETLSSKPSSAARDRVVAALAVLDLAYGR
jgi:hypothetical protein